MKINLFDYLHTLGLLETEDGRYLWTYEQVLAILPLALENNWIILGGDILTEKQTYTYCNWYYSPRPSCPLVQNVSNSVITCKEYIAAYLSDHGNCFYVELVIADYYVDGLI